jgi:hypothetical protein
VNKVDPPNWWVHHTKNPVQVMLTGTELQGALGYITNTPGMSGARNGQLVARIQF